MSGGQDTYRQPSKMPDYSEPYEEKPREALWPKFRKLVAVAVLVISIEGLIALASWFAPGFWIAFAGCNVALLVIACIFWAIIILSD